MAQQINKSKHIDNRIAKSAIAPLWSIVLLLLLLSSCDDDQYVEIYVFDQNSWSSNKSALFEYRVVDTLTPASVNISIRYNADMKLSVLPLEIKSVQAGSSAYWVDTVYMTLRDDRKDVQYSTRYTNHTELTIPYRTQVRYPKSGVRKLSIRHLGDSTTLRGVMSIGVAATGAKQ